MYIKLKYRFVVIINDVIIVFYSNIVYTNAKFFSTNIWGVIGLIYGLKSLSTVRDLESI